MRIGWKKPSTQTRAIRFPAVAGNFYPGSRNTLSTQVQDFIDNADLKPAVGELIGLIVPHAGYTYSGHVAGHAYKQLTGKSYDTVVLIGLNHRYSLRGAAIYAQGSFRTPLGDIEIDEALAAKVMDVNSDVVGHPEAHTSEHSLEVQLPFLQQSLSDFLIVPILLQNDSSESVSSLSQTVAQAVGDRSALLLGSTDLCHYPVYEEARKSDQVVIEAITHFDTVYLHDQMEEYMETHPVRELHCMMCSTGAIYTMMEAAKQLGGNRIEVLKSANSGDVPTGGRDQVVGYMAAAIYR